MITEHPMFNKTKEWILDILFPKKCLGCGREGAYICKDCEIFLSEVDPMLSSPIFGASTPDVDGGTSGVNPKIELPDIVSVWEYEGLMEKLIQKIKYDGCYDIIGELIEKAFEKIKLDLPQDTVVTFVPMYKSREKRRGFNQAEMIAKGVGKMAGRPVLKLLEKIKDNRSQVGLGPQERLENVKGAFRSTLGVERKTPSVKTKNVLLVDDVYTTGATVGECIKILKKAGVKNVWGFTLSKKMSIQNY